MPQFNLIEIIAKYQTYKTRCPLNTSTIISSNSLSSIQDKKNAFFKMAQLPKLVMLL